MTSDFAFGIKFEEPLQLTTQPPLGVNGDNPLVSSQIPFLTIGSQTWLTKGELVSPNYIKGSRGWALNAEGDIEASSLTLIGGTIKYGKTAFTDTTNAGYWIGSSGIYFGAASDASKLKYTIADGTFDFIGTISSRSTVTLASAIDALGHFIDANLDTSAKQILGDFTFGASGAIKVITDDDNGLWISPAGILGKVVGVNKFTVGADGNAYFAGTFAAGLIIAADISTGLYNQIDANLPSDVNLVAYWFFDEGKDLKANDISGNGNIGTLTNFPASPWTTGMSGTALDFDGSDDYVQVFDVESLDLPSAFTMSAWVYRHVLGDTGDILAKHDAPAATGYLFQINGADNLLRFMAGDGTTFTYIIQSSLTPITINTWHHVVVTRNGTSLKFYLDGVEDGSYTVSGTNIAASTKDLWIGRDVNTGTGGEMDGLFDEIRIYNVALTAKEVYALYKNPAGQKGVMIPTGRLTSGNIYSKQITLAVADGTGDTYIASTGFDAANWRGDGVFGLGIDDSDSNLAKFFVGHYTNGKYFSFDGANADATQVRYIERFTAGEALTAANVICLKPSYTDLNPTDDCYVDEFFPNTNYDDATALPVGEYTDANKMCRAFIKFDISSLPTSENILKAELRVRRYGYTYGAGGQNIQLSAVDSNWSENGTVTWNNQPTRNGAMTGSEITKATGADPSWMVWDVTQVVRQWKAGYQTLYGFSLAAASAVGANKYISYDSIETATPEEKPILRIYSLIASDGKVYKANCSDYTLSRCVLGITLDTVAADATERVQTAGHITNLSFSNTGGYIYLDNTAGEIVTSSTNLNRVIKLGRITAANKAYWNPQVKDILVEKLPIVLSGSTSYRIYAPDDATWALIISDQNSLTDPAVIRIQKDVDGITDLYQEVGASQYRITWSSTYLTIAGVAVGYQINVYFYT